MMDIHQNKVFLIIMDGWGKNPNPKVSAIAAADTPFIDSLYLKYPNAELVTHGVKVGLPEGQMGNSEVGHLNIGAGRIVNQELQRILLSIEDGTLEKNKVLQNTFEYCKANNKPLHLMGLLSDGGVHSHLDHLLAICNFAFKFGVAEVCIHAFTDGRDTDPKSGLNYIRYLNNKLPQNSKIVSICGRYFGMDRDKRWERIAKAYNLMVHGAGEKFRTAEEAIQESYRNNITDEFIEPILIGDFKLIEENDAVFCFNFRTDRCREITQVLTQQEYPEYNMKPIKLHYTTLTRYDETFKNVNVVLETENLSMTLGEVLSLNHKTQLRAAETEKYPHVTFFFSGGREALFPNEHRILVDSPKVATYDLQPEMSAIPLKNKVLNYMLESKPDFVCLNFANADMVGHTGVFEAAVKACETVDSCVSELVTEGLKMDYIFLITADHGNSDCMINPDGSPNTAHTKNPVPVFLVSNSNKWGLKNGKLGDLAPTILKLIGLEIPKEITGDVILTNGL